MALVDDFFMELDARWGDSGEETHARLGWPRLRSAHEAQAPYRFRRQRVPFLAQVPLYHPKADLNARLRCFELEVLDVVDVVVAKLKRFHANDRGDIEAMVERDLVPHGALVTRFQAAADVFAYDARADDLREYVRHLHVVERDFLGVDETEIELPGWIG